MLGSYSYSGKAIYLWNPATGQEIRRWPVKSQVKSEFACFTFTPDGRTLIAGDGTTIYLRDLATGVETKRMEDHPGAIRGIAVSPDGKTLASQARDEENVDSAGTNIICFWDIPSGKKLRQVQADARRKSDWPPPITHFEFLTDGKTFVTAVADGTIRTWDLEAGKELKRWDTGEFCHRFDIHPQGRMLAFIGVGNTVRFWDMTAGRESPEHPGHRHGVRCFAVAPDGSFIASGNRGDVRLWDTKSGRQFRLLQLGAGSLRGLHFSAGGRTLVTLDGDNLLSHWDTTSGKQARQLRGPTSDKYLLARSPDGKLFASVLEDRKANVTKIILWDAATGKKRNSLVRDIWWIGALGSRMEHAKSQSAPIHQIPRTNELRFCPLPHPRESVS